MASLGDESLHDPIDLELSESGASVRGTLGGAPVSGELECASGNGNLVLRDPETGLEYYLQLPAGSRSMSGRWSDASGSIGGAMHLDRR